MIEHNISDDFTANNLNDSVLVPSYPDYTHLQALAYRNAALQRQMNHSIIEQPVEDLGPTIMDNADLSIPPEALQIDNSKANPDKDLILTKKSKSFMKQKPKQNKTKPAFVMKLWTMVNDKSNNDYINWVNDGKSFLVSNREKFVQKVLPKYFKHSNFASFVRQLNMYGWHKVQDANSGSLHSDEKWQFSNPNFQRDKPELLDRIVRNKPTENDEDPGSGQFDVALLLKELNALKANQLKITQELSRVRSDNELLWQELFKTREKNLLQNDKIEKILQFLASVYGNNAKQLAENFQGQHTLQSTGYNEYEVSAGPSEAQYVQPQQPTSQSIDAEDYTNLQAQSQFKYKPRLMLKHHRHVSNPSDTSNVVDESPIEEIVRSPNEYQSYQSPFDQNYGNFAQTPKAPSPMFAQPAPINPLQQPFSLPNFVASPLAQASPLTQPTQEMAAPPAQPTTKLPSSTSTSTSSPSSSRKPIYEPTESELKPRLNHAESYKTLSKTVEQQGQDIDELINRLQQNQRPESLSSDSTTPSTNSIDQNFDLNDFLTNDILPYTDGNDQGTKKRGAVVDLEDADEVEEVFNPSKKGKMSQFS